MYRKFDSPPAAPRRAYLLQKLLLLLLCYVSLVLDEVRRQVGVRGKLHIALLQAALLRGCSGG